MQSNDDAKKASPLHRLLAEIDSVEAKMAVGMVVREPQIGRELKDSALQTYQACMQLILSTSMSHQQEREVWDRLAPIRQWLEVAGVLKR